MIDQESLNSIENLHRLKTEGIITDEEFERSKQRLLFGQTPGKEGPPGTPLPRLERFTGALPAKDDHVGWMTLPLRRYADFTGRSTRKEFWMFQIIYAALGALGVLVVVADAGSDSGALSGFVLVMIMLALIGLVVPLLAVEARRLHDQDRSGWLVLINLLPYVGALALLVVMLMPGTRGANRFGPDPLEP